MYITSVPNRNSPPAILLRESYRDGDKVKTRTIANLTSWKEERIEAMRAALRGDFDGISAISPQCGTIFGVLFTLQQLANQTGITKALGKTKLAKLALFLVLSRIAHQGSRLSAVRWGQQHAIEEILGLNDFDEDDLYSTLDWLAENQTQIETKLYQDYVKQRQRPPALVLYDITSSYFEGEQNELAAYGYNRDGKKGKKQIVIGLLTAHDGEPLAVRVFRGNAADPSTVTTQIDLLRQQFGIEEIVLVGDRGMIKAKGKEALTAEGLKYITALTDAQVRTLIKGNIVQYDLFDTEISEMSYEGKRYVLRKNEALSRREQKRREDKLTRLEELVVQRNEFIKGSRRGEPQKGLDKLTAWMHKYKLSSYVTLTLNQRSIEIEIDESAKQQSSLLDGCYVMETNVSEEVLTKIEVDGCYRDLQRVEHNFRQFKMSCLEVRPIFLRKANRTCAHVFVAMLALKIVRVFEQKLFATFGSTDEDRYAFTLQNALTALSRMTFLHYETNGKQFSRLTRPDQEQEAILKALNISFSQKFRKQM